MRPSSGGDSLPAANPRSRKSSIAAPSSAHNGQSSHVPTSFFMRTESEMEQSLSNSQTMEPSSRPADGTYGVQSLADTLDATLGQDSKGIETIDKKEEATPASSLVIGKGDNMQASRRSSKASSNHSESPVSSPVKKHRRKVSGHTTGNPSTLPNIDSKSPLLAFAMPSTPKSASVHSLKLSDEESALDDIASQVITSSGDEEDEETQQGESSSFLELVMPSIQMPKRRPFTTKGKAMGKLKVMVAGESGVGKTSLIRSIVQVCEDIVHVDPLSPSPSSSQSPPRPTSKSRKRKIESTNTTKITEIHASTKAYPHWWTDLEEIRGRRRKSTSDAVLERNLCFIDTPGFTSSTSTVEQDLVVDYVESLLFQNTSMASMEDSDLLGVVGGSGGLQVDVILYLVSPSHDISKDVEHMQRLSALTNVIPVIAKSDTLSPPQVVAIKTSILARLQTTSVKPFFFGKPIEDALLAVQDLSLVAVSSSASSSDPSTASEPNPHPFNVPTHPYAISSTPGLDSDTMDASLLMSPDYVQPLLPSELTTLVNQLFDPDSIAWLRHSAAKKFLAWRRRTKLPGESFILHALQQQSMNRGSVSCASVGLTGAPLPASSTSSIFSAASPSGVLVPRTNSPFYLSNYNSNLQSPFPASSPSLSHSQLEGDAPTDFSLARYNNHAQGEQRLAEVRLVKWAQDLQRSLRNERDRYEELQRNERAKWLLERISEEAREGHITTSPGGSPRAEWAVVRTGGEKESTASRYGRCGNLDSRDPLGLCDFSDEIRRRGYVLVTVLGGVSVIGAVVVAVVRACGVETSLPEGGLWSWFLGRNE